MAIKEIDLQRNLDKLRVKYEANITGDEQVTIPWLHISDSNGVTPNSDMD